LPPDRSNFKVIKSMNRAFKNQTNMLKPSFRHQCRNQLRTCNCSSEKQRTTPTSFQRPLRNILKEGKFYWTSDQNSAYNSVKKLLVSPQVLMPYDPSLPLLLATDASQTGLGAVLSHRLMDGKERERVNSLCKSANRLSKAASA